MTDHTIEKHRLAAPALSGATKPQTVGPGTMLRVRDVVAKIGLSRSTIYNKLDPKSKAYDPLFPKPVKLSTRSVGWLQSEVDEWLARQANLRR
ncbi:AlpA family transcriptional regulator [Halomonas sp. LR5S13]|uniref:helix-turn-helix transcriptional regulator n=1 Tax=Halomonas rhizosphaerae TaxID=3043296 RepID=UPI0024A9272A|nr:AlpA family transcriptional regulator [Halomonas rhizosphaerae]MDI5921158.1 AlpA family transcriptional regulator [Halomonas rhizosphaerae]